MVSPLVSKTKSYGLFSPLKKPPQIVEMAANGQLVFTDVDKVTFKGVGNTSNAVIDTTTGKIGVGVDSPDANLHVLGNCFVSTNFELGGTMTMGTVTVRAQHELSAITATGNTTPHTVEFQNAETSLVTTGNVEVGKELTVAGDVYVSSNLKVDTTTISTTVTDGVPSVSWATNISGTNFDSGYGYGIATDSGGNVYVIGEYRGTATFGSTTLNSIGSSDVFVAKYDTSGTVQWAKNIGGTSTDYGFGIATDSSGNVYVIGRYTGNVTIGSTTLDGTGNGDVFVAKYDTSGTDQWARSIGGTGPDYGYGIATDSSGNVFVTGRYRGGTITFAPDTTLTNAGPYTDDAFVAKYDTSGTVQWARGFGGGDYDNGYGIATDSSGNVYVTGGFTGSVTIGPGTTLTGSDFFENAFVAKYDTSGTVQWAKGITGQFTTARGQGIATDSDGNVYVTGYYYPTATFAPGTTLTSAGSNDVFVAKYDTSGTVQWAESIGGTGIDYGYGIATDSGGNVYVTGQYSGSVTIGSTTLPDTGSSDAFVAKYDTSGTVQWATSIGGTGPDSGRGIATDSGGNVYVTGNYNGTATFAPGTTLTSAGGSDAFVAKYSPPKYLRINTGLEVGTANLFVDSVNDRVGVGTSTPEATLHVEGNVYMSSNLEVGTANLFVDTVNSRVGVGTTSPGAELHVAGTGAIVVPSGTTAQQPTGVTGMIRFNTTTSKLEYHTGTTWLGIGEFSATGGIVDVSSAVYKIHKFESSGTFQAYSAGVVDILVVAGGGAGGGGRHAGGGGGGAVIHATSVTITPGSYIITIGGGGGGRAGNVVPAAGTSTTIIKDGTTLYTAIAGGYGGIHPSSSVGIQHEYGQNGGCGGGAGHSTTQTATGFQRLGLGLSATPAFGGNGGAGLNRAATGGGGGAGANGATGTGGEDVQSGSGGDGGVGYQSDITGTSLYWAGGGGGSASPDTYRNNTNAIWTGGDGGNGGGGGGAAGVRSDASSSRGGIGGAGYNSGSTGAFTIVANTCHGGNGGVNTGGGGGGAGGWSSDGNGNGGNGGKGIVVIRYLK